TAALLFGTRFVHLHRASTQIAAVERGNRLAGCVGVGHFHERETARTPGLTIRDNADPFHGAVRFEQGAKFTLGGTVRDVAYKQVFHQASSGCRSVSLLANWGMAASGTLIAGAA